MKEFKQAMIDVLCRVRGPPCSSGRMLGAVIHLQAPPAVIQTISCISSPRLHCVLTVLCAQKEQGRLVEGCYIPVAACGALINLVYKLRFCPFVIFSTAIAAQHLDTELGFSHETTKQQHA